MVTIVSARFLLYLLIANDTAPFHSVWKTAMKAILYMPLILALSGVAVGDEPYEKPMAHSSGETILAFCEDTEDVISQLRCNYYVQGVADLIVQTPLACLPQGMNQSELIEMATTQLKSLDETKLESNSGAALLLPYLQRSFRCPKKPGGRVQGDQKTDQEIYLEAIVKAVAKQQAAETSEPVTSTTGAAKNAAENTDEEQ